MLRVTWILVAVSALAYGPAVSAGPRTTVKSEKPAMILSSDADCRLKNLLECADPSPIYVPRQSTSVIMRTGTILLVTFDNKTNGSGVALKFNPGLEVQSTHLEITANSSRAVDFIVEYKAYVAGRLNIAKVSSQQSFRKASASLTMRIPMDYAGTIDEIVLNFFDRSQSAQVTLEAVRLVRN